MTYSDVHDLGDFPQVNEKADEDADLHHKVGFIVQDVQEHHQRLKHSKYDGAHRQTLERLSAVPELDICGGDGGEVRLEVHKCTKQHTLFQEKQNKETVVTLPFLKARNSKMLCTMETTIVSPSRYGLVSKRATYKKKVSPQVTDAG